MNKLIKDLLKQEKLYKKIFKLRHITKMLLIQVELRIRIN